MKKIPTLFTRIFDKHKIVGITDEITPGCEEAFKNGIATIKYDGACCAIINGEFYKRYDAKPGRTPPEGAIPCCEPDPVTGHWPHWVKVGDGQEDKWFREARKNVLISFSDGFAEYYPADGTYEAIGPHFQNNTNGFAFDLLIPHGIDKVDVDRDFNSIKKFLEDYYIEGLVFWLNGEPVCKIKRSDFGLEWNSKRR